MSLAVSTDRRIVGPKARQAFVEAILGAGPHEPETFWLEWKGEVNLKDKSWRGEIASHILGFSNRDPVVAARAVEGQGYIPIGVSPGVLTGIEPADPAELEDWLSPYLGGADGPHWDPDYVPIADKQVLLISVEPPRRGDPFRTLRRGFTDPSGTTHPEGTVFVRRNGKTVPRPSSAEMQMLQQRLLTESNYLGLNLELDSGVPLHVLDLSDATRGRWLEIQEEEMLVSLEAQGGDMLAHTRRLIGDGRTPDEYREEVQNCLRVASSAFSGMARARAIDKGINCLRLSLANQTENNYHAVLVELRISGDVCAYFSEEEASEEVEVPERPRPYGEQRPLFQANPLARIPPLPSFNPGRIEAVESLTTVQFPTVDLRPGYRAELGELYLFPASSMAGDDLGVYWHATSTSAPGSTSGALEIPISEKLVQLESLQGDN